jgi:serine/threonine-protein kinase
MSADEATPGEEQYTALFAAGEEVLASGESEAPCPAGAPSELEARLQRDLACVQLLRKALRRPPSAGTRPVPDSTGADGRRAAPSAKRVEPTLASLDEELRRLLRSRLILVHLLALALGVLIAVISIYYSTTQAGKLFLGPGYWLGLAAPLTECLVGAIVLWRSPGMSLRALRLWELAHFGIIAGYCGLDRFKTLVYMDERWSSPSLLPYWSLATLQGFIHLILAYGVFIPNTRRRSLFGVGALTAVPFAALAAAAAASPVLRESDLTPLVLQNVATMLFPAAIAVFAADRAAALQRRAFEAERRAEQIGQYALKRKLGEGGMGEVYLAEHVLLKQPCAVKLIRPEWAGDTSILRRFEREVQATARLKHWNTVQIYDYGHAADGTFYYVMEYLPGLSLEQLVKRHGPLPPARAVHLLRQACAALREAHAMGLIHRDIKPANMMVCERGGVHDVLKLLDFGLVKAVGLDSREEALTQQGAIAGTPAYLSPEQASGAEHLDARADVYSLGAVAYFLLTGQPPFQRVKAIQLIVAHLHEPVRPLTELRPDVPPDLQDVVLRCLEKDPARRFPDVTGLQEALAACACAGQWTEEMAASWRQVPACQGDDRPRQPPDAPAPGRDPGGER